MRTIVIIALFLLLMITGCVEEEEQDKIKIGILAPLTGQLSEYGKAFAQGVELANKQMDNNKFEIILEDYQTNNKAAISAFQKLTTVDQVDVIINWGTGSNEVIAPLVKDIKTPYITISFGQETLKNSKYIIRGANRPQAYAQQILEHTRKDNSKKIGIVKTQISFFDAIIEGLYLLKKSDEEIIIIDTFEWSDKDFKTSLLKIQQEDFDIIGVFLAGEQIPEFYTQKEELGITVQTFGTDFFESYATIEAAKGTMEEAVYPNMDITDEFREKYMRTYNDATQITFAADGYDFVMMLTNEVTFGTPQQTLESIKSIENFHGAHGTYGYKETQDDRYFDQPIVLKQIKNNDFITLN